jgi:hypothetical protein
MLSIKALAPLSATLLLAACASAPAPDYPPDHPANPAAAAAPTTPQSSPLATYRLPDSAAAPSPAAGAAPDAKPAMDPQDKQKEEDPHAGHR